MWYLVLAVLFAAFVGLFAFVRRRRRAWNIKTFRVTEWSDVSVPANKDAILRDDALSSVDQYLIPAGFEILGAVVEDSKPATVPDATPCDTQAGFTSDQHLDLSVDQSGTQAEFTASDWSSGAADSLGGSDSGGGYDGGISGSDSSSY